MSAAVQALGAAHASSATTNFTQQLAKQTFVLESSREGDTTTATATVVVGGAARTDASRPPRAETRRSPYKNTAHLKAALIVNPLGDTVVIWVTN